MAFDHLDPAYRRFVSYIDKSREYYEAHGYDQPYRWASNQTAPFTTPIKPLADARVAIVTTSSLPRPDVVVDPNDPPLAKDCYHFPSEPTPAEMFTADLSWHKEATTTEDVESFLPLSHLRRAAQAGRIGSASPRFYGVPTEYSQRRTASDAIMIEQWCREDDVDVALLVPL